MSKLRRITSLIVSQVVFVAATASSGNAADVIKLGGSMPLAGPLSETSKDYIAGAQTYFKKINEAGGVHGHKIEWTVREDHTDPRQAYENTMTFEKDKVLALFGYAGSQTVKAVAEGIIAKSDLPMVMPFTGVTGFAPDIFKKIFLLKGGNDRQGAFLADFAVGKLGAKDVGLIYQYTETGIPARTGAIEALKKRGLKFKVDAKITTGSKDIDLAVKSILEAKPKVVVLFVTAADALSCIEKILASGQKPIFAGILATLDKSVQKAVEKANAEAYFAQSFPSLTETSMPIVKSFLEDMKGQPAERLNERTLRAYIAAAIFVKGLQASGENPTRASLLTGMESLAGSDVGGVPISLKHDYHYAVDEIYAVKTENGEIKRAVFP